MEIHSDQGSNFESQVFKEMCKLLGLHKPRTTSLRPQSDGMVERFNATIENMLASFVSENQKDWDEYIFLRGL
jgi:transposase InsO family protein